MSHIDVRTNLDNSPIAPILSKATTIHRGQVSIVGILPGGMRSGKASVAIVTPLPGGQVVVSETSLEAFVAAARVVMSSQIGQDEGHSLPMRLDPPVHTDHGDPAVKVTLAVLDPTFPDRLDPTGITPTGYGALTSALAAAGYAIVDGPDAVAAERD